MAENHKVRVNWTIPAPIIIAILVQACVLGAGGAKWMTSIEGSIELYRQEAAQRASMIEGRLGMLEKSAANNMTLIERVKGVEVNVQTLKEQNQNIEQKIDKLIDRAGRR